MLCIAQEGVFNISHYTKYHVMVWKNTVKFPSPSVSFFFWQRFIAVSDSIEEYS